MSDAMPFRESGMGKIIMHELHRVREEEGIGGGVDYVGTNVVVGSRADVQKFDTTEVP